MKIKILSYYAVFTCDNETKNAIDITFPDLPGCFSCSYSYTQARKYAREALSLYLDGIEVANIPKPSVMTTGGLYVPNMEVVKISVVMFETKEKLWGLGIKRLPSKGRLARKHVNRDGATSDGHCTNRCNRDTN